MSTPNRWGLDTRIAVDRLVLYLGSIFTERAGPDVDQEEWNQYNGILGAAERVQDMIDDPPGPAAFNCLNYVQEPSVARTVAYGFCREYFDELGGHLIAIAHNARQNFGQYADTSGLAEVIDAQADALVNYRREAGNVVGTREDCPGQIVVDYPFGFGDSCKPKIPIWVIGLGGIWLFSKVGGRR